MKYLPKNHKQNQKLRISAEDLQQIMDSEFAKPMDEMDVDLIVLCSDILHARHNQELKPVPKKRIAKKTIIKMIAIAAVVSILVATLSINFADTKTGAFNFNHVKVASYDKKTMALDYSNIDAEPDGYFLPESEKLAKMKAGGIDPLILPEVLFSGGYDLYDITAMEQKDNLNPDVTTMTMVSAKFSKGDIVGSVHITKHYGFYFLDYTEGVDYHSSGGLVDPRSGEEITVNGIDVLMIGFERGDYYVKYFDRTQKTSYVISIMGTYEQAKEILQSIK